jgi:hypothetical protein
LTDCPVFTNCFSILSPLAKKVAGAFIPSQGA